MIRTHAHGDFLEISLARAEKRNALTPEMLGALKQAINAAPNTGKALLVSGEGAVFCAGFDLSLCKETPEGKVMRSLLVGLHECVAALCELNIPVVIAAQGAAIAGGCAILGGGDVIVTNVDAKLGYPVARLGVSPAVSAPFLANLAGVGAARVRQLENGLIDGRTALACGLAHECLDRAEDVHARALYLARELAAKPASALAATKRWLREIAPIVHSEDGLKASLSLVGGEEERRMLPFAWNTLR